MQTFIAVLKDLWKFAVTDFFFSKSPFLKGQTTLALTAGNEEDKSYLLVSKTETNSLLSKLQTENKDSKIYVATSNAKVFQRPVLTYDGVIKRLTYGKAVKIIRYEGRFAEIVLDTGSGWLLKDDLTPNSEEIFPTFTHGQSYAFDHSETRKLRRLIEDSFLSSELFLPLQPEEFITYCVLRSGHVIAWPEVRPRLAGSWQALLKGKSGVQIGVLPKIGAILEYTKVDGTGWLGYTKVVADDDSIIITGVGRLNEGEYLEEKVTKPEWQKWQPLWIQIL